MDLEFFRKVFSLIFILSVPVFLYLSPVIYRITHQYKEDYPEKVKEYPIVVGHDGVWCGGYFEFTIVEVSERNYQMWDTKLAMDQGLL